MITSINEFKKYLNENLGDMNYAQRQLTMSSDYLFKNYMASVTDFMSKYKFDPNENEYFEVDANGMVGIKDHGVTYLQDTNKA